MRLALLAPLLLAVALAGCDSAAERAETHYQRALAYLEDGDDGAGVGRVPQRLPPEPRPCRGAAALRRRSCRDGGRDPRRPRPVPEARRDPPRPRRGPPRARRARPRDPGLRHRHASTPPAPSSSTPADPGARALKATVDFRRGTDRPAAVAMAEGVARRGPRQRHGPPRPRRRPAAGRGHRRRARPRRGRPRRGARTTRGCTSPASRSSRRRATTAAVGDELATMNRLFPENAGVRAALVQWHLAERRARRGRGGAARRRRRRPRPARPRPSPSPSSCSRSAAPTPPAPSSPPAPPPPARTRAPAPLRPRPRRPRLRRRAAPTPAIAALREPRRRRADPPPDATRDAEVALAEMLAATGQAAESAALVEEVLAEDRTHVGGAEAPRPRRHRRRPARRGDPGHAHRADRRPARPRGDDDHGLRPRARRRPRPDGRAAGARGRGSRTGRRRSRCATPTS